MGYGPRYYSPYQSGLPVYSAANEIDMLRQTADGLRAELKTIDDRLHELESAGGAE
jgi:hypothetical protein